MRGKSSSDISGAHSTFLSKLCWAGQIVCRPPSDSVIRHTCEGASGKMRLKCAHGPKYHQESGQELMAIQLSRDHQRSPCYLPAYCWRTHSLALTLSEWESQAWEGPHSWWIQRQDWQPQPGVPWRNWSCSFEGSWGTHRNLWCKCCHCGPDRSSWPANRTMHL